MKKMLKFRAAALILIMMNNGAIVMELSGEERANMTTEKLLHKFHQQGMSNDRILFSAE